MIEMILSQAAAWGFPCECKAPGNFQIFPQQETERWKLQLAGDRWLLLISDVPQIHLHPQEVTAFLERRRSSCKAVGSIKPSP